MPGLNLGVSTGYVPAATLPPSYSQEPGGGTISSRAYGIAGASSGSTGANTAAYGSVGVGVAATALLVWLWYSLPR